MVLPFTTSSTNSTNGELPRILTEEEQILLAIDQGVHEVNRAEIGINTKNHLESFFPLHFNWSMMKCLMFSSRLNPLDECLHFVKT